MPSNTSSAAEDPLSLIQGRNQAEQYLVAKGVSICCVRHKRVDTLLV
jgi:hypothetical protein